MSGVESRYAKALELYRTTDMTLKEICERTDTPLNAFHAFLRRSHRDLLFARHGITLSPEEAENARLREREGQTPIAHEKYKDAINACSNLEYIDLNISQIARMFNLDPTGLGQQLRTHFPEIKNRREEIRRKCGLSNNVHQGPRKVSTEQYAGAVKYLRTSDETLKQVADKFGVSHSGLRQHLLLYHKDLVAQRAARR